MRKNVKRLMHKLSSSLRRRGFCLGNFLPGHRGNDFSPGIDSTVKTITGTPDDYPCGVKLS